MSTKKKKAPDLSEGELQHLASKFKLLGEPMRLKILHSVCHSPLTVNEIVEATASTQANVSKHLALLATAEIVSRRKVGQFVYYGIKDKLVIKLCDLVRLQGNEQQGQSP